MESLGNQKQRQIPGRKVTFPLQPWISRLPFPPRLRVHCFSKCIRYFSNKEQINFMITSIWYLHTQRHYPNVPLFHIPSYCINLQTRIFFMPLLCVQQVWGARDAVVSRAGPAGLLSSREVLVASLGLSIMLRAQHLAWSWEVSSTFTKCQMVKKNKWFWIQHLLPANNYISLNMSL